MDGEKVVILGRTDGEVLLRPAQKEGSDNRNILPTDDQLDRLVDSLCDSFPILQMDEPFKINDCLDDDFAGYDSENSQPNYNQYYLSTVSKNEYQGKPLVIQSNVKSFEDSRDKFGRMANEGRAFSNNNLNLAIIQCTGSLESLIQKRKSLELLVQIHRKVVNNYSFSYTPRLPDSPTRVDRLLFDVNQERCRVLGLISALDDTVLSFSSRNTKEELRKLLVAYARAITDVIKERQCEINADCVSDNYNTGILRLVTLINEVHRMNRLFHSALWCIEVKEQMNLVKLKGGQKLIKSEDAGKSDVSVSKRWQGKKTIQDKSSTLPYANKATHILESRNHSVRSMSHPRVSITDPVTIPSMSRQKSHTARRQLDESFQRCS